MAWLWIGIFRCINWFGRAKVLSGKTLAGFQSGVFQNYNTDFAVRQNNVLVCSRVKGGIRTSGGWTQIGFTPNWNQDKLTFTARLVWTTQKLWFGQSQEQEIFAVEILRGRLTRFINYAPIQIEFEFRQLNTYYLVTGKKKANHLNLGAVYVFKNLKEMASIERTCYPAS